MDDIDRVFRSEITITDHLPKNDLYELLEITPAKPLELKTEKTYTCDFKPRTDKVYVPKRRPKVKVKTVRDIRTAFENDTYVYLTSELEQQQKYLLNKIRDGSSRNESTQNFATKLLKSDTPISRSAWQMLANINPHHNTHQQQFVLWNGKYIQVNGSKGGKHKLICNYDLAYTKIPLQLKTKLIKNKTFYKRRGLLRNSLAIKFKPGPLARKKFLDDSNQKYHGDIELVDLPKVGLVVQPSYGTAIEPTITSFLSNLHKEDGVISEKWAEFSVSVLGKIEKSSTRLLNEDCVTFDLKYKCDQHRILMRKDLDKLHNTPSVTKQFTGNDSFSKPSLTILPEIKDMINKMIDTVEINIKQDDMFTTNEDVKQPTIEKSKCMQDTMTLSKEKVKRKYCELDRLDVTVIHLPQNAEKVSTQICSNAYCTLGCVCDSLKNTYIFRQHCGRVQCMFTCKCDFSKYSNIKSLDTNGSDSINLLPGIMNIEEAINMRLAKEEQKFHQTVIVTGEKNILMKSEKRNLKSSNKYDNFYEKMGLKYVNHGQRVLSISVLRINCENIEPWCMVHNLYKCFCKGKFTESSASQILSNVSKEPMSNDAGLPVECNTEQIQNSTNTDDNMRSVLRLRKPDVTYSEKTTRINSLSGNNSGSAVATLEKRKTLTVSDILSKRHKIRSGTISQFAETVVNKYHEEESGSESCDLYDDYCSVYNGTCSRINIYEGRKFSDGHYKNINYKIKEMEKNDKMLQKRLMSLHNQDQRSNSPLLEIKEKKGNLTENLEDNMKKYPAKQTTVQEKVQVQESEVKSRKENLPSGNKAIDKDQTMVIPNDKNLIKFFNQINGAPCSETDTSKKKLLSSENKLVGWLESNYKLYKKSVEKGAVKTSLEPPSTGKVALHPWEFILSRYKERKNLFMISKQTPYRIFMGVNITNPFFESCMNINDIRFADLHKYPQTVKNLLTNATDLKDNFCILRGGEHCWELVGSVAKVTNNSENAEDLSEDMSDIGFNTQANLSDTLDEKPSTGGFEDMDVQSPCSKEDESISECPTAAESSKWFIMILENDFTEIRFYKKGFFVKYDAIIKAINVARASGKTVRLSSHKCVENTHGPQFGIYAVPNASEYCVFIGPYEIEDSLGIETVKTILRVKRTRGFWMTTNKMDNLKIIDNPMSFIPLSDLKKNEAIPLESHFCEEKNLNAKEVPEVLHFKECDEKQKTLVKVDTKKIVKPIKIRKMNGFYHLSNSSLLKKISLTSPHKVILKPNMTFNTGMIINKSDMQPNNSILNLVNTSTQQPNNPNIKEGLQIRISSVYSQRDEQNLHKSKNERGMSILKPEEINRRLFQNQLSSEAATLQNIVPNTSDENSDLKDVEYPLFEDLNSGTSATLTPCTVKEDICIISDDESNSNHEILNDDGWKQVLILCTDVNDIGWIWGRRKCNPVLLSFKVPGGMDYTEFYPVDQAFKKLNSELSRIIGPTKPFDFKWKVIDSLADLKTEVNPLDYKRLKELFEVRKKQGSKEPSLALASNNVKTYSRKNIASTSSSPVPASSGKTVSPLKVVVDDLEAIDLVYDDSD